MGAQHLLRHPGFKPVAPADPLVVFDSFTDTDGTLLTAHTGETGATWTKKGGAFGQDMAIVSNGVRGFANYGIVFASGTPAGVNQDLSAPFDILTDTDEAVYMGTALDTGTADTGYFFGYSPVPSTLYLLKVVAGSFTVLDSEAGAWGVGLRNLRLERRTTGLKGFVDEVEVLTSSDTALTAPGAVGLRFGGSGGNTSGINVKSFTVENV